MFGSYIHIAVPKPSDLGRMIVEALRSRSSGRPAEKLCRSVIEIDPAK